MKSVVIVACAFLVLHVSDFGRTDIIPSCVFSLGDISIYVYSRENEQPIVVSKNETVCPKTNSVTFNTHGFVSEVNASTTRELSKALVRKLGMTVYAVDWSDAACSDGNSLLSLFSYGSAVENTKDIGNYVGKYIIQLMKKCNVNINDVTLMGHSLGAHVMSYAAKTVKAETGLTCARMVAMDPAAPLFESKDCAERLCENDTEHMVTIHTSHLGLSEPIGKMDVYPHGGESQPGCGIDVSCSHTRSVIYLTNSLEDDCVFVAVKWNYGDEHHKTMERCSADTCTVLDWKSLYDGITGVFYITVRHEEPYCSNATVLQRLLDHKKM